MIKLDAITEIKRLLDENPDTLPGILQYAAGKLEEFRAACEKKNNAKQENALGDALTILASDEMIRGVKAERLVIKLAGRIREVHYPDGIKDYHSAGERRFHERFFEANARVLESPDEKP